MLVLVMRYSRTIPGPRYNTATAVVVSEFIKLTICIVIHVYTERKTRPMNIIILFQDLFGPESHWIQMTIPAILYFIQNNLQYVAVTLLDAATFQVTYQCKIITTALFSVLLLSKSLTIQKWISLGLLTMGIAIVQLSDTKSTLDGQGKNKVLGLLAVLIACILSGLAGVWYSILLTRFEKVLKGTKATLFLRNVQLSFFSAIPGLIFGVYIAHGTEISKNGFFHGYNKYTWAAIFCQALGGLIVAMVVK
jgi:UDP-sugar transporter A1/2/3